MVWKIVRSAMLGVLLGVCGGMLIICGIYMANGSSAKEILGMIGNGEIAGVFSDDEASITGAEVFEDAMKSPEDVVVRFHVRANSDSDEDLALKYEVRDAVLALLEDDLAKAENDEEAVLYLAQHLSEIRTRAREVVSDAGYDYEVQAYIAREEFPIREYGSLVLPAGTYRALRVDIGQANGENFWCMLYPMMCYTIDSGAVIDSEDEEKMAQALDEETYEKLFVKRDTEDGEVKVKIRFIEWLQEVF